MIFNQVYCHDHMELAYFNKVALCYTISKVMHYITLINFILYYIIYELFLLNYILTYYYIIIIVYINLNSLFIVSIDRCLVSTPVVSHKFFFFIFLDHSELFSTSYIHLFFQFFFTLYSSFTFFASAIWIKVPSINLEIKRQKEHWGQR